MKPMYFAIGFDKDKINQLKRWKGLISYPEGSENWTKPERIQWIKLHGGKDYRLIFSDKLENVKEYILNLNKHDEINDYEIWENIIIESWVCDDELGIYCEQHGWYKIYNDFSYGEIKQPEYFKGIVGFVK